jgi:hypothetical protein
MWSDSPGTSAYCRLGIFGTRPGLGQCDRPGPGSLPLSHYLWQGIKTMSHLFFIISLVACNQRLEKNLICLLRPLVASLWLRSRFHYHVVILVPLLPRFRCTQDFTLMSLVRSLVLVHVGRRASTTRPGVTCLVKTQSASDYLRVSPPLNSAPLALPSSYFHYTSGCIRGCLLGAVCITFFWNSKHVASIALPLASI